MKTFSEFINEKSALWSISTFDDKTETEYSLFIISSSKKHAKLEAAVRFGLEPGKDLEAYELKGKSVDDLPKNHFNTVVMTDPQGKETYK